MHAPGPDHVLPAPGVPAAVAAASRVLLIEADESVALALLRGLRRHGWAVCWAATAQAGLKLQAEWEPHAVLLALDLPDMAAGKLVAGLGARGGWGGVVGGGPVGAGRRSTALAQGAHDVMAKPMRASEITARIHAVRRRLGHPLPVLDRVW